MRVLGRRRERPCDGSNNPPERLALGKLNVDLVPESLRDLDAFIQAKLRELADDPAVIDVRLDPEDPTKILVTRLMEPMLARLDVPPGFEWPPRWNE